MFIVQGFQSLQRSLQVNMFIRYLLSCFQNFELGQFKYREFNIVCFNAFNEIVELILFTRYQYWFEKFQYNDFNRLTIFRSILLLATKVGSSVIAWTCDLIKIVFKDFKLFQVVIIWPVFVCWFFNSRRIFTLYCILFMFRDQRKINHS